MKKITIVSIILVMLMLVCCSCTTTKSDLLKYTPGEFGVKNADNPLVEIKFSTGDNVRLELYPSVAPKTVENFIQLAKAGYYNGLTMHRIIEDFMIQGGGYVRNEEGHLIDSDEIETIVGEFSANGWTNNVNHLKGVISMARSSSYDSASSQFFICSRDIPHLDDYYCAFGRVIDEESMNAVVKISKVLTSVGYHKKNGQLYSLSDVPVERVDIKTITVYE